jgi:hypothetical protein
MGQRISGQIWYRHEGCWLGEAAAARGHELRLVAPAPLTGAGLSIPRHAPVGTHPLPAGARYPLFLASRNGAEPDPAPRHAS